MGIGRAIVQRKVWLSGLFVVLLALGAFIGRGASSALVASGFDAPGTPSSRADALLDSDFALGAPHLLVDYSAPGKSLADADFAEEIARIVGVLRHSPAVAHVSAPLDERGGALVSSDRAHVVLPVRLDLRQRTAAVAYDEVAPLLASPLLATQVGGSVPGAQQAQRAAEQDLVRAELFTLPLVALLLVVFFRGVVLATLPLVVGAFAVCSALACLRLLGEVMEVSIFAMNIVTFVGLGLAIDYSLFMSSRFRDELHAGRSIEESLSITMRTSGRTIAYSGLAVTVSLLALLSFPIVLLRSVAVAGSIVVVMSMLGALVFLPALLASLGRNIDRWSFSRAKDARQESRFWKRVADVVMRRPIGVTVLVTALLVGLGLPFIHVNPSVAGLSTLPEASQARKVGELLTSDAFPASQNNTIMVVAELEQDPLSSQGLTEVERYAGKLRALAHVTRVDALAGGSDGTTAQLLSGALLSQNRAQVLQRLSPLVHGKRTLLRATLDVAPTSDEALDTIDALRAIPLSKGTAVSTSDGARLLDLRRTLVDRMPLALSIVVAATFVVLFAAFGSLVMPLKAIVMNVLSLGASFGALVFIFQEGRLEWLFGFHSPGSIEITIPILMFSVVFGLAMDYELFLLSRIREHFEETGDSHLSVREGLAQTGQLITRAALLLVAVLLGFIGADMLLIKELGVGMAVAVIVDATIVRGLLVPATMQLLGEYNWWAPAGLRKLWLRSGLGVDERSEIPPSKAAEADGPAQSPQPSH